MVKPVKDKETIKKLYDASSPTYNQLYQDEQFMKYRSVPKMFMPNINDTVLDAGCGTGLLYDFFLNNNMKAVYYVGMDISMGQLLIAKRKNFNANIDLVYGDVDVPPFREKSFTHIFLITILHHSLDYTYTINILKKITKKVLITSFLKKVFINPPINGIIVDGGADWVIINILD